MNYKDLYNSDIYRYGRKPSHYLRKWHHYFRKSQMCKNKLLSLYYRFRLLKISEKHGIEISHRVSCGGGLYLCHPYCITINPTSILGKNVNIHKGVTIGQENRGKRLGTPTIGDDVWIGVNSTIVGKITIGSDVLIAPNSYVNCDVPSHSIVIGNPCKIIHRTNAVDGYINNRCLI